MSILFDPMKIGEMEVKNRFVRSATCEGMAKDNGEVSDSLIKTIQILARGEIGLIIPGYMYVHQFGKVFRHQTGIYDDNLIPGLKRLVDVVHEENGKIAFQLAHTGLQATEALIGTTPIAPSNKIMNPATMAKPKEMTMDEIQESIHDYSLAAIRAIEAGADAIQIHAAHGYLISQFISPFYNTRNDNWGGTDEKRFRYLKEIILDVKKNISRDIPLLVKMNAHDYTPKEGITPLLAAKYSKWLAELGIDALEVSCGSSGHSMFNMCRGDVPVKEITQFLPENIRPLGMQLFNKMIGKFDLQERYNLEAAKIIKPILNDIPLILVGGFRTISLMEDTIKNKHADFISMCRPFIRDPLLVKNINENKIEKVSCISCNRCLAALPNNFPVKCYVNKFPEK